MGLVALRSLRAGIRLRRRRRARNATAGVATAAVIAAAIPVGMGTLGRTSAGLQTGSHKVVLYIGSDHKDTVTPISAATNTAGRPIQAGLGPRRLAITPDGKTVYAANVDWHTVTPINTATNRAGKPITVGKGPDAVAITPDGRTVYVASVISTR
jgi:YVTN family beta-propeller protein